MKLIIYYIGIIMICMPLFGMESAQKPHTSHAVTIEELEGVHFLYLFSLLTDNEEATASIAEAIVRNRKNILRKMLATKKHNVNEQDDLGWTPLILAIYIENIEIITILLDDPDLDTTIVDHSGKDARIWAINKNLPNVASAILKKRLHD